MIDRGSTLAEYDYQWPALDLAFMASGMRWLMLALIVVGAGWGLSELFKRMAARPLTADDTARSSTDS
jgi:hypothetical protein